MARPVTTVLCCLLLTAALRAGDPPSPAPDVRTVPPTRVVRIPVVMLNSQGTASGAGAQDTHALMLSPGAVDELPEGPDGFSIH